MTEREKMFAGYVYDPFTEGMPEQRTRAHQLCCQYNQTTEVDEEKRNEILDELLPNRGEGVYLQGPINFDFGIHTTIGKGSYANFNFTVLDEGKVTIGDSVFIGHNVSLLTPIHPLCWQDRNAFSMKRRAWSPIWNEPVPSPSGTTAGSAEVSPSAAVSPSGKAASSVRAA